MQEEGEAVKVDVQNCREKACERVGWLGAGVGMEQKQFRENWSDISAELSLFCIYSTGSLKYIYVNKSRTITNIEDRRVTIK